MRFIECNWSWGWQLCDSGLQLEEHVLDKQAALFGVRLLAAALMEKEKRKVDPSYSGWYYLNEGGLLGELETDECLKGKSDLIARRTG